ncbi:unnamed protein product [Lactuca virosa]|uniref:Uncharacterized protein n=1 Tax=Lactuca virosa TaxID=75947 RepID=A0AAU9LL29_9ASTR|nr:unnamed protein product [Lactuca virosa]
MTLPPSKRPSHRTLSPPPPQVASPTSASPDADSSRCPPPILKGIGSTDGIRSRWLAYGHRGYIARSRQRRYSQVSGATSHVHANAGSSNQTNSHAM